MQFSPTKCTRKGLTPLVHVRAGSLMQLLTILKRQHVGKVHLVIGTLKACSCCVTGHVQVVSPVSSLLSGTNALDNSTKDLTCLCWAELFKFKSPAIYNLIKTKIGV